ncbi:unknown [Odoribacter sp. CAG:788]|nr:unknown [Odoribacter sp. CAG:788]
MNTVIFLSGVAAIVAFNAFIAFTLGWLFTEVIRLPLNFKPFTCRPCLTFWFTVIQGVILALILTPYFPWAENLQVSTVIRFGLIGVGVLTGLINFLYIKLKFKIYD